ncbi:MAG: hypothetical protein BKP49_04000 [Treponema sp. CETP13]|nr:MAG: hypothetical protein BKP49_04000 [Treponema sp. CETP13]
MKYSLAIFDMDGTVLNTISDIANAVNYTVTKYGYTSYTENEVLNFVGKGLKLTLSQALEAHNISITEEKFQKMFADFIAYYAKHSNDTTAPYDGIIDTMKELKKQGLKLALVSNKRHAQVQELCEVYFPGLLEVCYGEDEVNGINKKPAPDSVNAVLKDLNISAKDAVYIGDSEIDIKTAQNANMDGIAVAWGFRTQEFQKEHGATVFANKPSDLIELCI